MSQPKVPVVVITGPVGVGKSTIARFVGGLLIEAEIPCAVVDLDWLAFPGPRPSDDDWNARLA